LASDFEDILKAASCHQGDAPALSLQQRIGSNGRPADEIQGRISRAGHQHLFQSLLNRFGGMARGRRNLQDFNTSIAQINAIRERTPSIECDAHE